MAEKTYGVEGEQAPSSQIGASLEALCATIAARHGAGGESYTKRLLDGDEAYVLGKVVEEAEEVAEAALEGDQDHLRYEAADVVYHLMVVLDRHGISLDEFAAELNSRMTEEERPAGGLRLFEEFVNRGK